MAEVIKELEITVKPRITIDEDTARLCLKLVEMFLNSSRDYHFTSRKNVDGERIMEIKKYGES